MLRITSEIEATIKNPIAFAKPKGIENLLVINWPKKLQNLIPKIKENTKLIRSKIAPKKPRLYPSYM